MQRDHGGPLGLYGCHGLTTQRWRVMADGVISNGVSCIQHHVISPSSCAGGDRWSYTPDGTVRLLGVADTCLTVVEGGDYALVQACASPPSAVRWMLGRVVDREQGTIDAECGHVYL